MMGNEGTEGVQQAQLNPRSSCRVAVFPGSPLNRAAGGQRWPKALGTQEEKKCPLSGVLSLACMGLQL